MGVAMKYSVRGKTYWKVDEWLKLPDGRVVRFRMRKIPTREQAEMLVAKRRTEAFEGRFFDRARAPTLTVAEAWKLYNPVAKRDNDAWQTDFGRSEHLLRHLGNRVAAQLSVVDVDAYRTARLAETTRRKGHPSPGTLDREVELLKRVLNYSVRARKLPHNPIAEVALLNKPNVREKVVDERTFGSIHAAADEPMKPILLVAYDSGMRKREVLDLRWSQVNVQEGIVRLVPQDTKTDQARIVALTNRAREALRQVPRRLRNDYVFVNAETEEPWQDIRKMFRKACTAAGVSGVWFHDLRRSFVTRARKGGVPESVVMKMSGHKTQSVFKRYNIVDEEDVKAAVRQLEIGIAKSTGGFGQELDKVSSGASATTKPHQ